MKKHLFLISFVSIFCSCGYAQKYKIDHTPKPAVLAFADSIRRADKIPELGFALVTADSIIYLETLGEKRYGSGIKAAHNDRFHLGSNSKAITGFMAALLVEQNKIKWDTRFFDLFPELKAQSKPAYYDITLQDLLSHQAGIKPCTRGRELLFFHETKGSNTEQRLALAKWLLKRKSVKKPDGYVYSNSGYSMAASMLEKVSGRSWEELVSDMGNKLGINIGIGWPNKTDPSQPWGHYDTKPSPPNDKYTLGPLFGPCGDLNMSLPDYVKWVQVNFKGLQGKSPYLSQQTFEFSHYGIPHYAIGWGWGLDKHNWHISNHNGSAGTFYCNVYLIKEMNIAVILMANTASAKAVKGMFALREKLFKEHIVKE